MLISRLLPVRGVYAYLGVNGDTIGAGYNAECCTDSNLKNQRYAK